MLSATAKCQITHTESALIDKSAVQIVDSNCKGVTLQGNNNIITRTTLILQRASPGANHFPSACMLLHLLLRPVDVTLQKPPQAGLVLAWVAQAGLVWEASCTEWESSCPCASAYSSKDHHDKGYLAMLAARRVRGTCIRSVVGFEGVSLVARARTPCRLTIRESSVLCHDSSQSESQYMTHTQANRLERHSRYNMTSTSKVPALYLGSKMIKNFIASVRCECTVSGHVRWKRRVTGHRLGVSRRLLTMRFDDVIWLCIFILSAIIWECFFKKKHIKTI